MKEFLAIATLRLNNKYIGMRLLNNYTGVVCDFENRQVSVLLRNGHEIENIELVENQLNWTKGSKDRYPFVCKDINKIGCINSVIVIGMFIGNKERYYVITNYMGEVIFVRENRLIEYGKQYIIANCKVVKRGNKSYISAIRGEVNKIRNVMYRYDKRSRTLFVKAFNKRADKVDIPKVQRVIADIKVYPDEYRYSVKNMSIRGSVKSTRFEVIAQAFPNITDMYVEELSGPSELVDFKKLERVLIGEINGYYAKEHNLKVTIKEVKSIKNPENYGNYAFYNCVEVSPKGLFSEGLVGIGKKAMCNVKKLVHVTLPRSLRTVYTDSFEGCTNIEYFRLMGDTLYMIKPFRATVREGGGVTEARALLLEDSPRAKLYCSYEFPKSILDKYVAPHIKIIRDKPRKIPKDIEDKIYKGRALGLELRQNDIISSIEGLIGFLSIIDEKSFRNKLINVIKDREAVWGGLDIIEYGFIYLNVYFDVAYNEYEGSDLVITENFIVKIGESMSVIHLISLKEIRKRCNNEFNGIGVKNKVGKSMYVIGYVMELPHKRIRIGMENIEEIKELNEELIIRTKHDGDVVFTMQQVV